MELCEMIKIMQHYKDGSTVECVERGCHDWEIIDAPLWNWDDFDYRIKEPKQKVTIEKWLIKDVNNGEYFIMESSEIETYYKHYEQIKLIETYEVEL